MKKKILVIDDDALVLKSIKQILERSNYEVFCAKNGNEAENILDKANLNLIISDIRMPKEDGISVIKRLKERLTSKGISDIPFIFITGYASEDTPIEALKLGAKDYLLKPFDLDELIKSIQKQIS